MVTYVEMCFYLKSKYTSSDRATHGLPRICYLYKLSTSVIAKETKSQVVPALTRPCEVHFS